MGKYLKRNLVYNHIFTDIVVKNHKEIIICMASVSLLLKIVYIHIVLFDVYLGDVIHISFGKKIEISFKFLTKS